MTLDEARKILGLEDGERLSDRLLEIERARGEMEKLAEGVKGGEEGARFREGLEEFDVALETVKAEGEGLGLIERESGLATVAGFGGFGGCCGFGDGGMGLFGAEKGGRCAFEGRDFAIGSGGVGIG